MPLTSALHFLSGGGVCGELARAVDWAKTPLGPPELWPESLKTTVATVLHSRHPMFLWWGNELVQIYNDAYLPSFGNGKHPVAMGQRGRECWEEIWPIIGPQIDGVMRRGEATWHEDQLVPIFRNGRMEEVYWTYGYSPVFDRGTIGGTLVVCTETTARVRVERERRSLLEQAPVATALLDGPNHVFVIANPRYREMVGGRELLGKTYLEAFPELRDAELPGILDHVYATGESFVTSEMLVGLARPGDGSIEDHFFKFNLEPIRDAEGAVCGMMAVAVDITEQVSGRRSLELRNKERERLLADAEAASRAKDEFLAMLGHELRNPLAPILTALHLLRLQGGGQGERERMVIERQVKHLTTLVDDLLDVSRITRGKIELKRERIEIGEVVAQALEIASPLLEQRSHKLVVNVPREGMVVSADASRLGQAISNLLTNAAKYTEPGGRIIVDATANEGWVELSVTDNGIGIAADILPRVFDLFVQESQAIDRAQGGLGLGLAIARSLVVGHGGAVSVTSQGHRAGSTFTVRLPLLVGLEGDTEPPSEHAPASPLAGRAAARHVLVVDDSVDGAEILALLMTQLGCKARVAFDGPSALALLDDFQPDIALLDIGLPVMDGYELARHLRARESTSKVRLVAVTGYGQSGDLERSRAAGFDEHLVKPVELEKLEDLLSRVPPRAASAPT